MRFLNVGKQDKKIILASSLLFYLFFFFLDGVSIAADSASYINMSISREPVYPLFLAFLHILFGESFYLNAAVLIQCILAAFAAYWTTTQIQRLFDLNRIFTAGILAIQFGVTLLNRFVALRSISYQNSIQTEGIAISLYTIWAVFLIRYVCERRKRDLIPIFGIAILLICTRKQMLMMLPVIVIVLFCMHCLPKIHLKKLFIILLSAVLAFGATVMISKVYNLVYRGSFVGYTDSSNTFFTNMLYAADAEDKDLIQDQDLRILYEEIYRTLNNEKLNYKYAPEGLLNLETHYSECYDLIAITTVQPMIKEYIRETGIEDDTRVSMEADKIRTTIMKDVFLSNIPQMGRVYFASVVHGMILTIAKQHPLLNLYALACYLMYLAMIVWITVKKGLTNTVKVSLMTGLMVIVNVTLTAAVIFCQTRYMIYNMALCYIMAILLVKEVYDLVPDYIIQFIKFGLVGVFNTLFSYLIYFVAIKMGLHYQLGNFLAYLITVFVTFLMNGYWVFQKMNDAKREFWKPLIKVYASYGFTSLFLNSILLFVQIDLLGMWQETAPIFNLIITIPLNFLLNKYWAFSDAKEKN